MRGRCIILLIALTSPSVAAAQGGEVDVRWHPAAPEQGGFAWLVVEAHDDPPQIVRGAVDRAPLYFERHDDRFVAMAAVRLGAADSVPVALWLEYPGGTVRTHEVRLPVVRASFTTERLRVAPEFSADPDSALAARLRAETERVRSAARRAQETPRLWNRPFMAPRRSRITSPYGKGRIFNGELRSRHWGTDYDGQTGDPIRSANRGVVEIVHDFYYGGRVVYVNHGAGLLTAYMHMSESLVAPGDTVTRGQLIGHVGRSGRVTGPHLHWAARFGRASVNGVSLLGLRPYGAAADDETP